MLPDPIRAFDVVDPDPVDDTPSSFWLLAVVAGGFLVFYASIWLVGALLVGVGL